MPKPSIDPDLIVMPFMVNESDDPELEGRAFCEICRIELHATRTNNWQFVGHTLVECLMEMQTYIVRRTHD